MSAAKDQLIDALRLAIDDAWSYVVLGNIFTREQDWTSAIRFFSKALELKPGDLWALNGLGTALAKSVQPAQAASAFDSAIAANPKMLEPRFGKALALRSQGQLAESADTLQALIDTASSNSPIIDQSKKLLAAIEAEIREQGGPTNPELLQEKHPAAVWHLLDALKRFENLDAQRVGEITFEVARLGQSLSRRHKYTEKTSCPPRCRRPLRLVFSFQVCLLRSSHVVLRTAFGRQCWFAFFPECLTLRAAIMQPTAQKPNLLGSQPAPTGMCSAFQHFPSCLMYAGFKGIDPD